MKHDFFAFGEQHDAYPVPVLNERAVRASAGLLFASALVSFMNAWLNGNFQPTRVFVLLFLLDFAIRLFVNPRYSPSFILGQWFVRKQQPEYVGAPQKRFAWGIGFTLALIMFYLVVLQGVVGPVNILVCMACLTLMFFESAFGICLGCKVYKVLNREKALLCPGGSCEVEPSQWHRLELGQLAALVIFVVLGTAAGSWVLGHNPYASARPAATAAPAAQAVDPAEAERCKVPEFAKKMGHEELWKRHNNCL